MLKKAILGVTAALAMALTIPAFAAAVEWVDNGVPLEEEVEVNTKGKAKFTLKGGGGSLNCDYEATYQAIPKSETMNATIAIKAASCVLEGMVLQMVCKDVKQVDFKNAPYVAHIEKNNDIVITDVDIENTMNPIFPEFCPPAITNKGHWTLKPDNPQSISTMELSGSLTSNLGSMTLSGEGEMEAPETYGFE
jgi:hypothetical protein